MKRFLFAVLHWAGVTRLAAWWNRHKVVILCFHGVTENPTRDQQDPGGLHVNHRRFAAQLDFLQQNNHIVALTDFVLARDASTRLPPYSIILTFDDGYRNFLTTVAPTLRARKIPATVFLITDKASDAPLNNSEQLWTPKDDHSYLSWAEARTLQNDYSVQVGSHTCSHSSLTALNAEDLRRELGHSYSVVAQKLGVETVPLAYPKGRCSELIATMTREAGYSCGLTTHGGVNSFNHDLFTLRRVLIGDADDIASFAVRVSGLRWWLVQGRSLLLFFRRSRLKAPAPGQVSARGLKPSVE
jgi:peptidoglycan/xylan/chitin deacetylase (PgdA/CDA1 family)